MGAMKRRRALAAILLALALAAGVLLAVGSLRATDGTEYSVVEINARLTRDPSGWLGRTVEVVGTPLSTTTGVCGGSAASGFPCPHLAQIGRELLDATVDYHSSPSTILPIVPGPADPSLATLRRVPLFGLLLPRQQTYGTRGVATYRVQLQTAPCMDRSPLPCYVGVLLDAAT